MERFTMRRISYRAADAAEQLQQLCRQLSLQADVVSPRGKALTEHVFGQALTPAQVVARICTVVRDKGLPAVLHFTEQLDKVVLTAETIRVSDAEIKAQPGGLGMEFDPSSPEELQRTIAADIKRLADLVKAAGLTPQ